MSRLPRKVKELLSKSRDSALLAVEVYNKPATRFRSYGFICIITIAWGSLFHAIFDRKRIKYFYRKRNSNRYLRIDGEKKAWGLAECINKYYGDHNPPPRLNLRFLIGLRNKIEHRFLPALDLHVHGECQAALMNYEKLLVQEFGERFGLNESLAIPLQLLTVNPSWRNKVLKEIQSRHYETVKEYIDTYRYSLDDSVWSGSEYSFRVFLVPKIGNREKSSDISVEFVPYDSNKPQEMKHYEKLVAFIREKQVPVVNPGKLKPGDVSNRVQEALGFKFRASTHHAWCWKHYEVRPKSKSKWPTKTKTQYCQYDDAHKDYVYTEEWVEFLIAELSDPKKKNKILGHK